jgi:hypothetical protein
LWNAEESFELIPKTDPSEYSLFDLLHLAGKVMDGAQARPDRKPMTFICNELRNVLLGERLDIVAFHGCP